MSIGTMPTYEAYKDSGVEWIGEVPDSWEVTKLGSCLTPKSERNRPDLPLLSITREGGVVVRDIADQDSNHNYIPDDLSNYKILRQGQFGMNKMKAWQGSYGVSKHTGIVSPAYFVFNFTKKIHPDFFNFAIRSKLYISYFGSASDGVRIGQWDLSKTRMKAIPLVLPSYQEQATIANFLNKKTAQIDAAITIKEQQITLLKERKQIMIQQAVTQGLNPDVPMKNSGVEWIGEIPKHWKALKLKRLFSEVNVRSKTGEEVLLSLRMDAGLVPHNQVSDKHISNENLIDYKVVHPGQLVMNRMRAAIGIFGIPEICGLVSPDYAVFNIHEKASSNFYLLLFKTSLMGSQFRLSSKGMGTGSSGFMRLYTDAFGDIKVPCPPKKEQLRIVSGVQNISSNLERAINIQHQQIQKLKEYKTTLINSAVTGKIKVTSETITA